MNIFLAWLVTSAEFLLIDTANSLRIFKTLADQGLKIDYNKFWEFYDNLNDDSKDYLYKMFIPFYNFYKTYTDIRDYNILYPYLIKEMYALGLLENMSDFELREYQKNPSIINALRVPIVCAKRLENAYVWELQNQEYTSTIWFELSNKKGLEAIDILQVKGFLAKMKPEEIKEIIETYIVEDAISKSIKSLIDSEELPEEEKKIIASIYYDVFKEDEEESKKIKLTKKKK
mgnify:FL=1